jgi:ABC-type phosphate transport system substrate-binding protein
MKSTTLFISVLGLLALLVGAGHLAAQDSGYKIIVHSTNPASSMSRGDISKIFLKQTTKWSDGRTATPLDLPESSATRARFTKEVHNKSVDAIKAFWQQKVFSGRAVPPLQKGSVEEIVSYVESNPGAVGYVPSNASIGNCKVLSVR